MGGARPGAKPHSAGDKPAEMFLTRLYGRSCAAKEVRYLVTPERDQYRLRALSQFLPPPIPHSHTPTPTLTPGLPLPPSQSACVGYLALYFLSTIYPGVFCARSQERLCPPFVEKKTFFFLK